jgi:hypothetical protein
MSVSIRWTPQSHMYLTLNPLTWKIWWAPNNACRWQMGFNSSFKWLIILKWFHENYAHLLLPNYAQLLVPNYAQLLLPNHLPRNSHHFTCFPSLLLVTICIATLFIYIYLQPVFHIFFIYDWGKYCRMLPTLANFIFSVTVSANGKVRIRWKHHVKNLISHSLELKISGVLLLLTNYDTPFKPRPLSN